MFSYLPLQKPLVNSGGFSLQCWCKVWSRGCTGLCFLLTWYIPFRFAWTFDEEALVPESGPNAPEHFQSKEDFQTKIHNKKFYKLSHANCTKVEIVLNVAQTFLLFKTHQHYNRFLLYKKIENAIVSETEGLRFKLQADQIGHNIANS